MNEYIKSKSRVPHVLCAVLLVAVVLVLGAMHIVKKELPDKEKFIIVQSIEGVDLQIGSVKHNDRHRQMVVISSTGTRYTVSPLVARRLRVGNSYAASELW